MFKRFNRYNFSKNSFQDFIKNDTLASNGDPLSVWTPIRWYDSSIINPAGIDWNTMLVSSWDDLMGNDNMVQTTLANKPVFNTLSLNGKPSIQVIGNDTMISTLNNPTYNTDYTVCICTTPISFHSNRGYFVNLTGVGWTISDSFYPSTLSLNSGLNQPISKIYGRVLNSYGFAKSSLTSYLTTGNAVTIGVNTASQFKIGDSSATTANIMFHEIIIYDKALSQSEIQTIETYFKFKWGAV